MTVNPGDAEKKNTDCADRQAGGPHVPAEDVLSEPEDDDAGVRAALDRVSDSIRAAFQQLKAGAGVQGAGYYAYHNPILVFHLGQALGGVDTVRDLIGPRRSRPSR